MNIAAWLAGFVLFSLGVFHLSLWYIFRNRLQGYLGLGWLANIAYIILETKVEDRQVPLFTPFLVSICALVFFVLAESYLSRRSKLQVAWILLIGFGLSFLLLAPSWQSSNFLVGTAGGAFFSAYVYISLGWAIRRVHYSDFEVLIRGHVGSLFRAVEYETRGPLVDKFVDNLQANAQASAKRGRPVLVVSFVLFGLLQIAYPFRDQIRQMSSSLWPGLFVVAMVLKLSTAVGFSIMLRASATLVEAKIRRGSLAEELSKITTSVEHDMRAPIREMTLIAKNLKRKYQHDPYLQNEVRAIEFLILRIKAVMDLILSMRENPDDYRKRSDKCNLGVVVQKAVNATKALHSEREVIIKLALPSQSVHVYGYNERLTQAVTNLINNAAEARIEKYPNRPVVVEVRLKPNKSAEHVTLEIEDDGVGIDPQKLRFVKEAYYSTKESGANPNRGLGLFMADRIVGLHGGEVKIASLLGAGTTVTVTLPWPKALRAA